MNAELKLSAELFESLLGSTLAIVNESNEEQWRVTKVDRRASHALRESPFNVYFAAPITAQNRAQCIRRARLSSGDEFDFFAVPIAANATEISLEVIFN